MSSRILYILILMSFISPALGQAPQIVPGWPHVTDPLTWNLYQTPRLYLQPDPPQDALFFNGVSGDIDKFRFDANQFPGWPLIVDSALFILTSPIIVDLDHDGRMEVVTSAFCRDVYHDLLIVVDDNGAIMPGFPILSTAMPASLNVFDFDNDGEYEILRYTILDDMIHCFDRFGNYKPGWPIQGASELDGYNALGSGGAVGDLDLDGYNEYILMGLYHIYAYRYDGSVQAGFPIVVQDSTTWCFTNGWVWPPILADLDQDNYLEIVVAGENWCEEIPPRFISFISIYEHDGALKNGWPIYYYDQLILQTPLPCDIDDDGDFELGFQTSYNLNFIDLQGSPLPGWPITVTTPRGTLMQSVSDLILLDIDGDNDREIFTDNNVQYDSLGPDSTYLGHGLLCGFDHLGQYLPGFPIVIGGNIFSRPPNFGYDPVTHRVYMTIYTIFFNPNNPGSETSYVELYVFPDSTGPPNQWPMMSHDLLQTRNYNFVDRVTSIEDDGVEILPKSPILRQNYPNPFNFSTIIEFTLPKEQQVSLSIFDMLGRKVVDIYDEVLTQGTHRYRLNTDMPSGIYLCRLKTETTSITRKMALVK
ncbi:MAG: hypothetical protein A2W25_17595 [candidate division Zixibacteria bacterium RBG_16_53_22]|nr:MAG: hypothetical protein A2W25_17595 [candidate division Zixibacteria bacterium RBG_16_53_22]